MPVQVCTWLIAREHKEWDCWAAMMAAGNSKWLCTRMPHPA